MKEIVLAGGCFWGVDQYFKMLKGVETVFAGYAQSDKDNPSYEDLCNHTCSAVEVAKITYHEYVISLETLFKHLFRIIDPTSFNKQGGDIGIQYRTGIYVSSAEELKLATDFITLMQNNYDKPICVEVEFLNNFYFAEDYHQNYLINNPNGYCHVNFAVIEDSELKDEYKRT